MPTLTFLNRKEIKSLSKDSTPLENICRDIYTTHPMLMPQVMAWYKTHGILAGKADEKKKKLTEIFGTEAAIKPAVWGFLWEDEPVILSSKERGTYIEVRSEFPPEKAALLLLFLRNLLILPGFRDNAFFSEEHI